MIEELLLDIVKTESEWESRVRESVGTSKDIVSVAKAKVIVIDKACREQIKSIDTANVAKAEAEAKVLCDEIMKNADKDAAYISSEAVKQSPDVISDIIRRLEKKYA